MLAAGVLLALPAMAGGSVVYEGVPASTLWVDAVEPGALRLACSSSEAELAGVFAREALPFRRELLRKEPGRLCHVFYRPTLPGFRVAPDDDPLTGVDFDTDAVLYVASGSRNRGEPVGVMKEILQRIPRPLAVSILIHRVHDQAAYEKATQRNFGGTPHRVALVDRGVDRTFWWVQDWMKAGSAAGRPALLLPRRIFEGKPDTAQAFAPMLDRFGSRDGVVRSRLSWEGGDLLLTRDPRDRQRLVLFHGDFVKPYWAETLTASEYQYVLGLEFGADRALDLGGLAPHVDYFISFLPQDRLALVSVPVWGDMAVARAAVLALLSRIGNRKPRALVDLRDALSEPDPDQARVRQALAAARREAADWQLEVDPTLAGRMQALAGKVCSAGGDCLSPVSQLRLIEADPETFADWIHATQAAADEPAVIAAHLDLVEGQLQPVPEAMRRRVLEKIGDLETLGFRVVRVPAFRVDLASPRSWPGISYVNALVVDRQVFVPRFGLGEVEDRVFADLQAKLPPGYSVLPIEAQRVLVRNGGLHCLAGLVR